MVFVRHPSALFTDELWVVDERFQFFQVDVAWATGTGTHFASVRYDMSGLFGHIDSPFEVSRDGLVLSSSKAPA